MPKHLIQGLVTHLEQSLQQAAEATVQARSLNVPLPGERQRLDLLLKVTFPGGLDRSLAVELLREAYPRDVRQAVWQLDEYRLAQPDPQAIIPMVAAEHLSAGARDSLRKRNIGYFDASGSLYLKHGGMYVNVERPRQRQGRRKVPSLFVGAREMVVHALLHSRLQAHDGWLTGLELAELSQTSAFTASTVLHELERQELLGSTGSGRTLRRRLTDPAAVLDAWAEQWKAQDHRRSRWYVYARQPRALLAQLSHELQQQHIDTPWAFTGAAAANIVSPLLTSVDTAELIIPSGHAAEFEQALGLKPADKGANVTLVERDGASLLLRTPHQDTGGWLASPFILYLDLLDGRGRNKELAQQLRHDILQF
jgi:hypothetical protein